MAFDFVRNPTGHELTDYYLELEHILDEDEFLPLHSSELRYPINEIPPGAHYPSKRIAGVQLVGFRELNTVYPGLFKNLGTTAMEAAAIRNTDRMIRQEISSLSVPIDAKFDTWDISGHEALYVDLYPDEESELALRNDRNQIISIFNKLARSRGISPSISWSWKRVPKLTTLYVPVGKPAELTRIHELTEKVGERSSHRLPMPVMLHGIRNASE